MLLILNYLEIGGWLMREDAIPEADRTDDGQEYVEMFEAIKRTAPLNPQAGLHFRTPTAYVQPSARPAANVDAIARWEAEGGRRHAIAGLIVSYSAIPAGGRVYVADGSGSILFDVDLATAGAHVFNFTQALVAPEGGALVVTLAAGGAGVTGKVNVIGYRVLGGED